MDCRNTCYCVSIALLCVFQLCRSAIPGKKKMTSYSLKVTRAERERIKIINPTRQTYINVTDSTACVPYIVTQCREDFDDDSLELVTTNGLAIEDSESTRGKWLVITDSPGRTFFDLTFSNTKLSNLHFSILLFAGLPFWKANSQKLFAVSTVCKKERKRKKLSVLMRMVMECLQKVQICHLLYKQVV